MAQRMPIAESTGEPGSSGPARRPDIGNRTLVGLLAASAILIAIICVVWLIIPAEARRPGLPVLHGCAVAGSVLLVASALHSVVKRGGLTSSPPAWFIVHVLAGLLGTLLVFVHAAGRWASPPALLLLLAVFLAAQGVRARVVLSRQMADIFGTRLTGFTLPDHVRRRALHQLIEAKRALLPRLDAGAREATFSPSLRHWLRHPMLAVRFTSLASKETRLIGARGTVSQALAWWRRLHIAAAALLLCGILLHMALTTFFAGYVAGGREIYWWHATAWGGAR